MFKWLNNKKKENKGFTLVELVIVVAILAILVGLLAPQYTKYVERSRKAADAANLDNMVTGVKVATADGKYDIVGKEDVTFSITIEASATTLSDTAPTGVDQALIEYCGTDWKTTTLKSKSWEGDKIEASIMIGKDGSVTVTYTPSTLKNEVKE